MESLYNALKLLHTSVCDHNHLKPEILVVATDSVLKWWCNVMVTVEYCSNALICELIIMKIPYKIFEVEVKYFWSRSIMHLTDVLW